MALLTDGYSLMAEAHRLRVSAMSVSSRAGIELDEKGSAMWIIRQDAWGAMLYDMRTQSMMMESSGRYGLKRLMGLPVRLTIDDEEDTPFIQLVMEPKFVARAARR